MNDMIGASGMLRGWAMVGHMYLVWLLVPLAVSVAVAALVEWLIAARRAPVPAANFVVDHAALGADMQVEPR